MDERLQRLEQELTRTRRRVTQMQIAFALIVLGGAALALPRPGRTAAPESSAVLTNEQLTTKVKRQARRLKALETLLAHFSRVGSDVFLTGANLHIRSGSGATDGAVNGLGNLIVGYNELRATGNDRSGSHNLLVGKWQNFSSYGGFVAGLFNTASGTWSSVSGGVGNTASGNAASISGGQSNLASGIGASVTGGDNNTASGQLCSVSGGWQNLASADGSSVSGGEGNIADASLASVSGGRFNTASGLRSSVSGGFNRTAVGNQDWVAGSLFQDQ